VVEHQFFRRPCCFHFITLKTEAERLSEMSLRCYNQEDHDLNIHHHTWSEVNNFHFRDQGLHFLRLPTVGLQNCYSFQHPVKFLPSIISGFSFPVSIQWISCCSYICFPILYIFLSCPLQNVFFYSIMWLFNFTSSFTWSVINTSSN
jgi:hypothetical protein